MKASSNGDIGIVKLLLDVGADPNISTNAGKTALMMASANGYLDMM